MKSAFLFSELFEQFHAHDNYPWLFHRSRATLDLCRANKFLDSEDVSIVCPKPASRDELEMYHRKSYLDLLQRANTGVFEESMLKNGVGTLECPVYNGCFDYHSLAVGASITAAALVDSGGKDVVFSPTGGFHHAGPDFASGFCYLNDVNVALAFLVEKGFRVFYVDIDVHHCDLVQEAWFEDDRVFTMSFHESGKTLFPWNSGFETELGKGKGRGFCVNAPLPAETGDDSYVWAFNSLFPPLSKAFKPDLLMAVTGADTLHSDPNSHLLLTTAGYCQAVELIAELGQKIVAIGGGGYNLDSLSRAWTLAWAILNGFSTRDENEFLYSGEFRGDGIASLHDRPLFITTETRDKTRRECERIVSYIEKNVFPIHGLKG
jgi:acetoin utilization protein AcuC